MRILVDNSGYELLNLGDVAMLQVAVSRFGKLWPRARITIITTAPELLKKYCPGTIPLSPDGRELWLRKCNLFGSLHQLMPRASRGMHALEARIRRRAPSLMRVIADARLRINGCDTRPMTEFLDAVYQADLVVGTGGGYLTDSFAEHAMDILETLHLAQSLDIPTALLGQGLGPVSQPRVWNPMRRVLPKLDLIALREGVGSRALAERLEVSPERVIVTGDDALPMAIGASAAAAGTNIGVNLRTAWYAGVPEGTPAALEAAVRGLSKTHDAPVIPLPVSAHAGGEDRRAIAEVIGQPAMEEVQEPRQLIERIGTCRLVITGSYHAAVFALAQGIPIIALVGSRYYADKFAGLSAQFHNVGCITVTLDQPQLPQRLIAAGDRLMREGPHVRERLARYAQEQATLGEWAYERLAELVARRRVSNGHVNPAGVRGGGSADNADAARVRAGARL